MDRARLSDVAARAGVSTATASLVLRDRPGPGATARSAVRAAAADLGYRPDRSASALARSSSSLIGVVFEITHPFHTALVDRLDLAFAQHGLDLVLSTTTARRDERAAVDTLIDSRCAAVVLLGTTASSASLDAMAEQVPAVVIGRPGTRRVSGVRADDEVGMRLAVDHLVDLGHERIAWVDGGRGAIATARRRGYRRQMGRRGLAKLITVVPGGPTELDGVRAGALIVAEPATTRPTALACFNDRVAVGVRDELIRGGVFVPGELSLLGYDDSPLAALTTVELTSVSQHPFEMAQAVVAAVDRLLGGAKTGADTVVEPQLVVRGSTRAPGVG